MRVFLIDDNSGYEICELVPTEDGSYEVPKSMIDAVTKDLYVGDRFVIEER